MREQVKQLDEQMKKLLEEGRTYVDELRFQSRSVQLTETATNEATVRNLLSQRFIPSQFQSLHKFTNFLPSLMELVSVSA